MVDTERAETVTHSLDKFHVAANSIRWWILKGLIWLTNSGFDGVAANSIRWWILKERQTESAGGGADSVAANSIRWWILKDVVTVEAVLEKRGQLQLIRSGGGY